MTSLQDGKKQYAKHESVILKVDMIHDQETGMQEEGRRYESLGIRIWYSADKPDEEISNCDMLRRRPLYFSRTAPRTSSVRITVTLWYAMTLQAE
jgi:hypothetical protein